MWKITSLVLANLVFPTISGILMIQIGASNCNFYGIYLKDVPCNVINFLIGAIVSAVIFDLLFFYIIPKLRKPKSINDLHNPTGVAIWQANNLQVIHATTVSDITYGDKISDSIKDVSNSFNKTETKVYIQDISKNEIKQVARQLSYNINEFEKRFNAIRNGTPKEMSDQYIFAREKLNQIINDDLPKSDLVFKEARQIREKLLVLQSQYNNYGSSLVSLITEITQKTGVFNKLEIMKGLWGINGKPPSLNGQINLIIRELVDLLNSEYRNE